MKTIFKEGDREYHFLYGWGDVIEILDDDNQFWVRIQFDKKAKGFEDNFREGFLVSFTEYTLEGFSQELPEPLPKPGDIVWVRDTEYDSWMITYFRRFNDDATKRYGANPRNSADSLSIYYYKYLTTKNPYANE